MPTNLGTLLSHLLCLSLSKLSRNGIWDTAISLKYNFKKLSIVVHFLHSTQNWSFHVVVLERTPKKCTNIYNVRAQQLFCSLNLLFSDVAVAVGVEVILNSLIRTIVQQVAFKSICKLVKCLCISEERKSTLKKFPW